MGEQTAISLVQAIYILITLVGILVFMAGSVLLAEFIRRERTPTKDDDWFERSKLKPIVTVQCSNCKWIGEKCDQCPSCSSFALVE